MEISVVIPVYNAAKFLPDAIASVVAQPQVREILLVDDGSKDESLSVCHAQTAIHPGMIRVLTHPGGSNYGAAATRNLGMRNATSPFIAFLDADDVYLTDRFAVTSRIFTEHPEADAVYETVVSVHIAPDKGGPIDSRAGVERAALPPNLPPQEVFRVLAIARSGYIHLNGFVMRKSALSEQMYFDPSLRPCEDTDLLLRWAAYRNLVGGDPDRVISHRRVHETNTVFNVDMALCCRYTCMRKCAMQGFYGVSDRTAQWAILNRMTGATPLIRRIRKSGLPVTPFRMASLALFLIAHPKVLKVMI